MIAELAAAIERGERVVLATVVGTERSVPRRAGTKMLVFADGSTIGTVGGGEMEYRVRTEAAIALTDRRPRLLTYDLLDPRAGDPGVCGGRATIYLEPFMPSPTLLIIGAGHVGAAVAHLAGWLGHRVVVWDDRPELVDDVPGADRADTGPIEDLLDDMDIGPDTSIVVVTRNVDLDLTILPPVLESEAGYVGVMGSNRRWAKAREGLKERGVPDELLAAVHAPIGIEIDAETPEEIAVSILAQVIAARGGAPS
ncbi:MAG: XdhC family protein [Acidimicrobiales bacterium]